jgi:hypothetical protein
LADAKKCLLLGFHTVLLRLKHEFCGFSASYLFYFEQFGIGRVKHTFPRHFDYSWFGNYCSSKAVSSFDPSRNRCRNSVFRDGWRLVLDWNCLRCRRVAIFTIENIG